MLVQKVRSIVLGLKGIEVHDGWAYDKRSKTVLVLGILLRTDGNQFERMYVLEQGEYTVKSIYDSSGKLIQEVLSVVRGYIILQDKKEWLWVSGCPPYYYRESFSSPLDLFSMAARPQGLNIAPRAQIESA